MRDGILAGDDGAVGQTGADVVTEHAVYYGNDTHTLWDAADNAEEVDCAFKVARKETCSGKEEVANRGRGEIEGAGRACTFQYLKVQMEKCSSDKLSLR